MYRGVFRGQGGQGGQGRNLLKKKKNTYLYFNYNNNIYMYMYNTMEKNKKNRYLIDPYTAISFDHVRFCSVTE